MRPIILTLSAIALVGCGTASVSEPFIPYISKQDARELAASIEVVQSQIDAAKQDMAEINENQHIFMDATVKSETMKIKNIVNDFEKKLKQDGLREDLDEVLLKIEDLSERIGQLEDASSLALEFSFASQIDSLEKKTVEKLDVTHNIGGCAALPFAWNGLRDKADKLKEVALRFSLNSQGEEIDRRMAMTAQAYNKKCGFDTLK